ncbi:Cof-type HAD-IIB family hydrolase [Lentilactobacillus farraginis]|uniref:HAD superfamily hydrolase n=2 Tax=Lentilactobacillus farraginis DSM 18382 = JCM 14108 TaxID=1423743 RepID=A0A0R1VEA6_9LACO|nr:Cof-type HAD-IIB family hydrolase [Lentilactobacillus farraginis]KRM03794.1 HAD superfamily hydrolase [Lentilactobacillus farraginis DSM 18382 = JCM 14108]
MIDTMAVFDLDGTLCDGGPLTVSPATVTAIQTLKARQVLPVIATGRSHYEIIDLLHQLDLHTYILANGCYIIHQDELIQDYHFPIDKIEAVIRMAQRNHDDVGFFNQQGFAITGMNDFTRQHVNRNHLKQIPIYPEFFRHEPVNFLNLYIKNDKESLYQSAFQNQLSILRYAPDAVDVMPLEISKAQGILKIKQLIGNPNLKIYAFGDQNNDLSMFSFADYGIAMHQASDPLKQRATYIAQTDHGVLEGLQHYRLI